MSTKEPNPRAAASRQLRRAAGSVSTGAIARMDAELPWFGDLSAEARSYVGLIVQAGVKSFIDWYADGGTTPPADQLATAVFGAAPQDMAGVVTLQQTVELVRLSFTVVEHDLDNMLDAAAVPDVHAALLRYGRELAFATAEVYARAAEVRGAWDARLEALVVDAVLRDEHDDTVLSRASAVGWSARGDVAVILGTAPEGRSEAGVFDAVRRSAREVGMDALCAVQGHLLVVILGGVGDAEKAAKAVVDRFDAGPVVVGPVVADLGHAHRSAAAASAALRAAPGWPEAPRPVCSDDLLPERILAGDEAARQHAVEEIYAPLDAARGTLVETLAAYFANGGGVEATGRALFVHANTVRYRLGQVADLTGLAPSDPRDGLTLQLALILGRQAGDAPPL